MTETFQLTQFDANDADRIAGLSLALQRDWRRRGFLPEIKGRARFDAFALARMVAMKALADRGIGPSVTADVADTLATGIVMAALTWRNAWTGDVDAASEHAVPDWAVHAKWAAQSAHLTTGLYMAHGVEAPSGAFVAWFADGSTAWSDHPGTFFAETSGNPKYAGAVVILDTNALGTVLLDRAGSALVSVTANPGAEPCPST